MGVETGVKSGPAPTGSRQPHGDWCSVTLGSPSHHLGCRSSAPSTLCPSTPPLFSLLPQHQSLQKSPLVAHELQSQYSPWPAATSGTEPQAAGGGAPLFSPRALSSLKSAPGLAAQPDSISGAGRRQGSCFLPSLASALTSHLHRREHPNHPQHLPSPLPFQGTFTSHCRFFFSSKCATSWLWL